MGRIRGGTDHARVFSERRAPLRPHGSFETSTSKENSAFFSLKSLYVSSSSSRYVREPMFFE